MYREKSEPAGSKHCSEMGKERYKKGSSASESADGDIKDKKDIAQQRVDELLTRLALSRRNKEWLAPRDSEGRSPESRDQVAAISRWGKGNGRTNCRWSVRGLMAFPRQITFEYCKLVRLQYYNIQMRSARSLRSVPHSLC